jgi:hypothetical protein
VRETVEREADGSSVSYGWHLSPNLLKACVVVSVKATCVSFEVEMGALCRLGPLDTLREQEKTESW